MRARSGRARLRNVEQLLEPRAEVRCMGSAQTVAVGDARAPFAQHENASRRRGAGRALADELSIVAPRNAELFVAMRKGHGVRRRQAEEAPEHVEGRHHPIARPSSSTTTRWCASEVASARPASAMLAVAAMVAAGMVTFR